MSSTGNTNPGNFANRPKEEVIEIAKKGGQASHGGGSAAMDPEPSTGNTNPGNFANRPKEEVSEFAKKGGQASHKGGFASMDPEKQVFTLLPSSSTNSRVDADSYNRRKLRPWAVRPRADRLRKGSEAAKEAGRKGASSS